MLQSISTMENISVNYGLANKETWAFTKCSLKSEIFMLFLWFNCCTSTVRNWIMFQHCKRQSRGTRLYENKHWHWPGTLPILNGSAYIVWFKKPFVNAPIFQAYRLISDKYPYQNSKGWAKIAISAFEKIRILFGASISDFKT